MAREINPTGGSPEIPGVTLSTRAEQRAVFRTIYHELVGGTIQEVEGRLKPEGIAELNTLRGVLRRLATNLGLKRKYLPEEWVYVGVKEFVPEQQLAKWAYPKREPTEGDLFTRTARYFYEQKDEQQPKETPSPENPN